MYSSLQDESINCTHKLNAQGHRHGETYTHTPASASAIFFEITCAAGICGSFQSCRELRATGASCLFSFERSWHLQV